MTTILERLAETLSAAAELSSAQHHALGFHLLDTLGAWLAGSGTDEAMMLAHLGADAGIGEGPLDAMALRVATIRLTEIDDIHMPSCTTPSAVVVPVALTLATTFGNPCAMPFAQALSAGYEAITRLGSAVAGPALLSRGIWPTYLAAPFGAAAVTARMLGLDAGKTADALAIALTMASGGAGGPSPGASPRWILAGQAARAGALAAFAAARGFSGDRTLLDGDWLSQVHGINCDTGPLLAMPEENGAIATLSLKPYCAAKQTVAAIDAFRELLAGGVRPAEIMTLRVSVPAAYRAMISGQQLALSRQRRITSVAYNLALAAYRPEDLLSVAREDFSGDERIAALLARVEVTASEELSLLYPRRWPARVTAVLANGQEVSALVIDAPGDPGRALDSAAVQEKFHCLADPVLGRQAAEAMAAHCLKATEQDDALESLCVAVAAIPMIRT